MDDTEKCHTVLTNQVCRCSHFCYSHCYIVVTLLLHCCYTVGTLLLHFCYTLVTLLLYYCCTVVALLLHCCYTVVTLLSHCCHTVVTLLLHCCYTVVMVITAVKVLIGDVIPRCGTVTAFIIAFVLMSPWIIFALFRPSLASL
jgi:hypothetical protein